MTRHKTRLSVEHLEQRDTPSGLGTALDHVSAIDNAPIGEWNVQVALNADPADHGLPPGANPAGNAAEDEILIGVASLAYTYGKNSNPQVALAIARQLQDLDFGEYTVVLRPTRYNGPAVVNLADATDELTGGNPPGTPDPVLTLTPNPDGTLTLSYQLVGGIGKG